MRIDYTLMSEALLSSYSVKEATICGKGVDRDGFVGSDHSPITLVLERKAEGGSSGTEPATVVTASSSV
jgi:hypothetical protein